jgi:hypothetical protein
MIVRSADAREQEIRQAHKRSDVVPVVPHNGIRDTVLGEWNLYGAGPEDLRTLVKETFVKLRTRRTIRWGHS